MLKEFYRLLSSNPVEIRCRTHDGKWRSEYVTSEDDFVDAVPTDGEFVGVYASLQQLKDRIKVWENGEHRPISQDDVEKYTAICFDCDPERKGAATPEQTERALQTAKNIGEYLKSKGWGEPTYLISGNGAYCIFKIDLPKEDKPLIHGCLLAAQRLFGTEEVKVDTTLASEGQIIRIPGTKNLKVPAEPREAKLLTFHEMPPVPVPRKLVVEFADPIPEKRWVKGDAIPDSQFAGRVADVAIYFKKRGYEVVSKSDKDDCTILQLASCPCNCFAEQHHHVKQPYVYVFRNGNVGFKCFADKHAHITWKNIEQQFNEQFDAYRSFDNQQRLAEEYLEENHLVVVEDDTYRYDNRWIKESLATARMKLRPFIQSTFDERARHANEPSKPVAEEKVKNTLAAVQSVCLFNKPPEKVQPFFLVDHAWNAADVLMVANGLLNIRKYVEGKPFFIEPTWEFFTTDASGVVYDPEAKCPTWHRFLDSLDRSTPFVQTINELLASAIWDALTHQNIINLFGQGGGGKGVIGGVAADMCHGSTASVYLKDLIDDKHVLQDVPGKKLILLPESKIPRGKEREVVSILKSMTGRDKVPINPKNNPPFSTVLTGTFVSQTNEILRFDDPTNAFNRRLIPLPFAKSWREDSDNKPDPMLPEKLKAEYSGILNVVLEAAKTLHQRGRFMLPPESEPFLASSRDDANPIADFQADHLEYRPGSAVQGAAVHNLFLKWAAKNGVSAMREQDLYSAIREAMSGQVTVERMTSATASVQHDRAVQQTKFNQNARKRLFLDLHLRGVEESGNS